VKSEEGHGVVLMEHAMRAAAKTVEDLRLRRMDLPPLRSRRRGAEVSFRYEAPQQVQLDDQAGASFAVDTIAHVVGRPGSCVLRSREYCAAEQGAGDEERQADDQQACQDRRPSSPGPTWGPRVQTASVKIAQSSTG
jgi:hypothetical protein